MPLNFAGIGILILLLPGYENKKSGTFPPGWEVNYVHASFLRKTINLSQAD